MTLYNTSGAAAIGPSSTLSKAFRIESSIGDVSGYSAYTTFYTYSGSGLFYGAVINTNSD